MAVEMSLKRVGLRAAKWDDWMVGLMNDYWTGTMTGTMAGLRAARLTVKVVGWVVDCWIDEMIGLRAG